MQFKKLAAITGSALMAGLCLAAPVLATSVTALKNINTMVSTTGTVLPVFVIGSAASPADVAGAVDIAAGLAQYAKTTSTVTTTTGVATITNGVTMATPSNPIVMWDNFSSSKQVLTVSDLPDILPSETYSDAASVTAPYAQYLTFNNTAAAGQVVFNTPSGGTSPALGLKFTGGNQIYNYLLSFTKQISEAVSSTTITNMINTPLTMLGQTWTITGATVSTAGDLDLTMLAGQNSQTVTTSTPATFTVGSNTYTVTLVAVGSISSSTTNAVTVTVSGGALAAPQTLQILTGGTKTLSDGTMVGVSSIFATSKTGAIDSATIFVGANRLELEDTNITDTSYNTAGIKLNGNTITDASVRMIGTASSTALTLNSIELAWSPTLDNFITSGNSLPDEVTNGAFKIFFGGITPALADTTNREMITVTPSGTSAGISFKDAAGNSLNQNFVYSSAAVAGNTRLADAGNYTIHVLEGETVFQNEYMVLGQNSYASSAQNPFGHILRVLSLSTSSTSTSQFQDVASGTTLQVTGGNTTMYLDGQAYKIYPINSTAVQFTWGSSAGYGTTGSAIDVYPTIQTSKGAWVALTKPVTITGLTQFSNYTLQLPTGALTVNVSVGPFTNNTVNIAKYETTNTSATSLTIKATDSASTPTVFSTPGVLVVEGLDASTLRNVIALKLDSDATYNRVDIPAVPSFTSTATTTATVSGTTQNQYMDTFGSYVVYDSTMPGTFSISYPSSQAVAIVGVGKSPTGSAGAGGTISTSTVLPVTADIVKMDTDSNIATVETANDLIIVGGPCVNQLAAQLLGVPAASCGASSGITPNTALVQLFTDHFATGKTALLVAGWEAADTKLAAEMVQQGFPGASSTLLAGNKITITGTVTSPAYS